MKTTAKLRELLRGKEVIVAPGAWDGISAKVIEQAGFPVVYVSGFCLEASILGAPDVGLLSFGDLVDRAFRICAAVSVPVVLDTENGFGGPLQVMRTVKELERAGVAGIHIEDQIPLRKKRLGGQKKEVLPAAEAVAKIKAAVDSRTDPDFLIIARCDIETSLQELIDRCNLYLEAGADMIMPITTGFRGGTPAQLAEVCRRLAKEIKGPCLGSRIYLAEMTAQDAQAAGYKMLIYPLSLVFAGTQAMMDVVEELKVTGTPNGYFKKRPGIGMDGFFKLVGLPKMVEFESKHTP